MMTTDLDGLVLTLSSITSTALAYSLTWMTALSILNIVVAAMLAFRHALVNTDCDASVGPAFATFFNESFSDPGVCTEGDVRLANGVIEQEGRPEVCINGVWGSICQYSWSTTDAYVFCNQLGHDGPCT